MQGRQQQLRQMNASKRGDSKRASTHASNLVRGASLPAWNLTHKVDGGRDLAVGAAVVAVRVGRGRGCGHGQSDGHGESCGRGRGRGCGRGLSCGRVRGSARSRN